MTLLSGAVHWSSKIGTVGGLTWSYPSRIKFELGRYRVLVEYNAGFEFDLDGTRFSFSSSR